MCSVSKPCGISDNGYINHLIRVYDMYVRVFERQLMFYAENARLKIKGMSFIWYDIFTTSLQSNAFNMAAVV